MIVVMEKTATEEQIVHIAARVQEIGLKAHIIRGTERTVIACIGDERKIKVESFESGQGFRRFCDPCALQGCES